MHCLQVGITELETSNLQGLDAAWVSFCQMLDSSGSSLERSKESFRERLLRSIEASAKEITEARDRFLNHAPFSHVVRCMLSLDHACHRQLHTCALESEKLLCLPCMPCQRAMCFLQVGFDHAVPSSSLQKACLVETIASHAPNAQIHHP